MKTAVYYVVETRPKGVKVSAEVTSWIRQIQLDAFKAGMTESAIIGTRVSKEHSLPTAFEVTKQILTARDNKTAI